MTNPIFLFIMQFFECYDSSLKVSLSSSPLMLEISPLSNLHLQASRSQFTDGSPVSAQTVKSPLPEQVYRGGLKRMLLLGCGRNRNVTKAKSEICLNRFTGAK
jgi:hypothetical protein